MNDLTPMPFGKYKGTPMQDVPATYLHWFYHNVTSQNAQPVHEYIEHSMNALKMENKDLIWINRQKNLPKM